MQNGYALPSRDGLIEVSNRLGGLSEEDLDALRKLLRIGIQWNTQVTLGSSTHKVSQAYCSALPVAYSIHPTHLWEKFARLVLEASYEATICAAILNLFGRGTNRVFLTLLGGGAFGNETDWIMSSLKRVLILYRDWDLEVVIVSYGVSRGEVRQLVGQFPPSA